MTAPRGGTWIVAAALAAATLAVFAPVVRNSFINFDDRSYIDENPRVSRGLSLDNLRWALTATEATNWHPLTWLAHMLDVEIFGLKPGGHHLTSLLYHAANAVLLFLVLVRATGALWRSALAAALFALHPLHVESVAWAAEKKDVVSAMFWMLATWAYLGWTSKRGGGRYLLMLVLFALGLAAKPMLVTLPFVFMLLDFWPLGRMGTGSIGTGSVERHGTVPVPMEGRGTVERRGTVPVPTLLLEKAPLFALSAASSAVTYIVQKQGGAMSSLAHVSFPVRLANALVSYVLYLWKTVWPSGLTVFYPYLQRRLPWWQPAGAALLLLLATLLILRAAGRRPYLAAGWFWYLGTLVPVIGLVQVGLQSMADRYTYLPLTGVFLAAAWGLADAAPARRSRRAAAVAAVAVLLVLSVLTRFQVGYWRDGVALFEHSVSSLPDNWLAHLNLGVVLASRGKLDEAMAHYRASLRIVPDFPDAYYNIGNVLARQGKMTEALEQYRLSLKYDPGSARARNNLGATLANLGWFDEAEEQFREAMRLDPGNTDAASNLAKLVSVRPGAGGKRPQP